MSLTRFIHLLALKLKPAHPRLSSGAVGAASTSALSALADSTVKAASIMAASAVGAYVQANAGLGIVN